MTHHWRAVVHAGDERDVVRKGRVELDDHHHPMTPPQPTYRQWMTRGHKMSPPNGAKQPTVQPNIIIHQTPSIQEPSFRSTKLEEIKSQFVSIMNEIKVTIKRNKVKSCEHNEEIK